MHEDKLKVDLRSFEKQKRQQKIIIRDLSMIHHPLSSESSSGGKARASESSSGCGAASWSQSSKSSISSRMSKAPKAEVIHQKMPVSKNLSCQKGKISSIPKCLNKIFIYIIHSGVPGLQTRGKANEHQCHLNQRDCANTQHWSTSGCHKLFYCSSAAMWTKRSARPSSEGLKFFWIDNDPPSPI